MVNFITTQTTDGIIFNGVCTTGQQNDTVIVDVHGLSWDFYTTPFYRYFYDNINKSGVDFLAGETRAAYKMKSFLKVDGSYHDQGGAFEKFEECLIDIRAWIDLAERIGYKNIWLSGYSFGPSKAAYYYANTRDTRLKGLIFFSPSDVYGLTHEPSEYQRHTKQLAEAKSLCNLGNETEFLSELLWGVEKFSASAYLSLFDNPNNFVFNYFKPTLGFETLNKIDLPVLSFTGTRDEGITACADINAAMSLLDEALANSPRKEIKIFDGAEHSFKGYESELLHHTTKFVLD